MNVLIERLKYLLVNLAGLLFLETCQQADQSSEQQELGQLDRRLRGRSMNLVDDQLRLHLQEQLICRFAMLEMRFDLLADWFVEQSVGPMVDHWVD